MNEIHGCITFNSTIPAPAQSSIGFVNCRGAGEGGSARRPQRNAAPARLCLCSTHARLPAPRCASQAVSRLQPPVQGPAKNSYRSLPTLTPCSTSSASSGCVSCAAAAGAASSSSGKLSSLEAGKHGAGGWCCGGAAAAAAGGNGKAAAGPALFNRTAGPRQGRLHPGLKALQPVVLHELQREGTSGCGGRKTAVAGNTAIRSTGPVNKQHAPGARPRQQAVAIGRHGKHA